MMNLTRRQFCSVAGSVVGLAGLSGAGASLQAAEPAAAERGPFPLRVIAYNVYKCTGAPHDRPLARRAVALKQMPQRLALELALYEPDIIAFSESPDEELTQEVARLLKMRHIRFPSGGNWPGTLLTRLEVVESKNVPLLEGDRPRDLFTRHWGRCTVKLSNGAPLIVHSAHLHPAPDPSLRQREITAMLASMQDDLEAGRSMLLIGDLNHTPEVDEYKRWMDAGWVDTFAKVGEGKGLTFTSDNPYRRIDYILAAGPIAEQVVEARPLYEGAFRLNVKDDKAFALSDHLPQYAVFDAAKPR